MLKTKFYFTLLIFVFIIAVPLLGQDPPPPPDRDFGGDPVGGSAPIGDGVWFMIAFALIYMFWKFRKTLRLNKC
jgi:hypothetical protein